MPFRYGNPQRYSFLLVILVIILIGCRSTTSLSINEVKNSNTAPNKLKLQVKEDGIYRLTTKDLAAAGITISDPSSKNIQLTQNGQNVPTLFADESLIFYGNAPDSRYVNKRPYILEYGKSGLEMTETPAFEIDAPLIKTVSQTLHLEENHEYVSEAKQSENEDVWFWNTLRQQDVFQIEADLPSVENGPAVIRINAWGFTYDRQIDGDHSFDILINNIPIGSVVWDGQTINNSETKIPEGVLQSGVNTIILDNQPEGASFLDIMQINWIELAYTASATAVDDFLKFSTGPGLVKLENFHEEPLIFNINNPLAPELISNLHFENEQILLPISEEMNIIAVGSDGFLSPEIEPMRISDWHDVTKQADLIIITSEVLAPSLEPLVKTREEQGLTVALVPVEEIYDEFGYGEASPESIRQFVTYAYNNWQAPQPQYLFLVGDATTDYLGNLGDLPENTVPSLIVPVQFSGETVSDSRLADIDGDMKPDMAVGRWPVRTPEEVVALVERTIAYESGKASDRIIFASDGSETRFNDLAGELTRSSGLQERDVTFLEGSSASEIIAEWNKGSWLTTYIGHGSISRWGKDGMFELDTVNQLEKETPPIVLQLTCLTGLFSHPEEISLSEAMLTNPNGPVLTVAATSLTLSGHQEPFAVELLKQIQNPNVERIGDAFQKAKLSLEIENSNGLREISDTFALFGDPSTIIVRP